MKVNVIPDFGRSAFCEAKFVQGEFELYNTQSCNVKVLKFNHGNFLCLVAIMINYLNIKF